MNMKYDPTDLVQVYFKALQDAWTFLVSLQETAVDKVLIRQDINQFNKNIELNEAVDDWKKKSRLRKHGRNLKRISWNQ